MATLLSEVLDRCVDLVVIHGWTIDDCVSEWPEHAADLGVLLSTALQLTSLASALRSADQVPVRPAFTVERSPVVEPSHCPQPSF